ncbi:MAG TPA: DUF763 domain-containing protein, partial [Nitrososphaeria archaeon]|nr:DUF763 domain-containing protein [Nitrososphaeria archaeon]
TSAALRDALVGLGEGLLAAGGKGAAARTLDELRRGSEVLGLTDGDAEELERASRLTAKVDSAAVQDGYQPYHHMMFFSEDGDWAVVQQGMSAEVGLARRYHWFSGSVEDFVEEPHSGIIGWRSAGPVLNMVARESAGARRASVEAAGDIEALRAIRRIGSGSRSLDEFLGWGDSPSTRLPEVYVAGMDWEVDWGTLEKLYEVRPRNYEELLLVRGVGAKAVRALALVSDLIYGERASWRDPVKFSFAHGGKDGIPFPVDRDLYDRTIAELEDIVRAVEGEGKEREEGRSRLRRLSGLL